eukprot:INCI19191.1.p1 GENE.INCI19191.1~~INCI19191.1.p1  ORF type:complete len:710 (-),score=95.07 INCI19191.1:152-2281(-)
MPSATTTWRETLHKCLDGVRSSRDQYLDDVTRACAEAFDVRAAIVTFLDFSSSSSVSSSSSSSSQQLPPSSTDGIFVASSFQRSTSPRWELALKSSGLCTFSVGCRDDPVSVVPDLSADLRFRTQRLVAELGARFYAGATIWAHINGSCVPVGVLSLLDSAPQSLSESRRRLLRVFASSIESTLDARVSKQLLVESEARNSQAHSQHSVGAIKEAILRLSHETRNQLVLVQSVAAKQVSEVDAEDLRILRSCCSHVDGILRNVLLMGKIRSSSASAVRDMLVNLEKPFELQTLVDSCTRFGQEMLRNKSVTDSLNRRVSPAKSGAPVLKFEAEVIVSPAASRACGEGVDGITVLGNQQFLTQIATNLISNAIKYTEQGKVVLSVNVDIPPRISRGEAKGSETGPGSTSKPQAPDIERTSTTLSLQRCHTEHGESWNLGRDLVLHLTVKDTGPGIREEDIAMVMCPFGQVKDSADASTGTGLGLPIAKMMASQLGGSLSLYSRLGQGTDVVVRAPLQAVVPESTGIEADVTSLFEMGLRQLIVSKPWIRQMAQLCIAGRTSSPQTESLRNFPISTHVLVVEDNIAQHKLYRFRAKKAGLSIEIESSPHAALQRVKDGERFGVVIVDLYMPDMTGDAFCRSLRNDLSYFGPVVCATGNVFSKQQEKKFVSDNGFSDLISKGSTPSIFDTLTAAGQLLSQASIVAHKNEPSS